ncbi:MAG: DUF4194 domain-containing protein [Eubacteriales bacterium]|jgi:Fe2+ or Zn2+ uptake regulation protein
MSEENDRGFQMTDEESLLFKRTVRTLLTRTFIVNARSRDQKCYSFIRKHSNDIREYLRYMGFDLVVDDNLQIACLIQGQDEEETAGFRRLGLQRFTREQTELLLVLWEQYLEKVGMTEEPSIMMEELTARLDYYGFDLKIQTIRNAVDLFSRYSLVDMQTMENGDEVLVLYPSLQFCMDLNQLRQVVEEYGQLLTEDPDTDESGDDDDDLAGENTEESADE